MTTEIWGLYYDSIDSDGKQIASYKQVGVILPIGITVTVH